VNLPEDDRRRVEGILARLTSEHDGERAAAGLLLGRLLAKHGKRPEDLVNGGGGQQRHPGFSGYERMALQSLQAANAQLKQRVVSAEARGNRFESEAARLRNELGAVKAELAKARHQANPGAYQTPPWEDDAQRRQREQARANADAFRAEQAKAERAQARPRGYGGAAAEAAELLARKDVRWTPWETDFLTSITAWNGALTDRQEEVMEKLRAKVRQSEAAAKMAAGIW
jgi:hypothetical protein